MKQSPELQKAQESMQPGVITLHGFLGPDERNLVDMLIDDDGVVKRLGLTHLQIAARMEELRDSGNSLVGNFVPVEEHIEVLVESSRGKLPSPFGGRGMYGKINTTVRNTSVGNEIVYSDLHIHLIKEWGFYQGRGSRFRLEPGRLAEVLELKSQDVAAM